MIHRTGDHVPFRWLADLRDGRLPARLAAEAGAHLASGCVACRASDASIRRIVAAIAAGPIESPPPDVDRRVVAALARARRAARPPRERAIDTLFGEVVLDQRLDLATAMRSAGSDARRILWRLGPWEVDASVVARDGRADLLGQVVAADDAGSPGAGEIRIVRSGRVIARSALAVDGRFTFRRIAAGTCALEGTLDGRSFVLPPLVLE